MKLNMDCVRDVLLTVEDQPFNKLLSMSELTDILPNYSEDELTYTCDKLQEGGLLDVLIARADLLPPAVKGIRDLTFEGHEFLDQIRPPERWDEVKNITRRIGTVSLKMLSTVSEAIITAALKNYFS